MSRKPKVITEYTRARRALKREGATEASLDDFEREILLAIRSKGGIGGDSCVDAVNDRLDEIEAAR